MRRGLIGFLMVMALLIATAAPTVEAHEASGTFLDVPAYAQQRNLSCEYAALTIATGAFGYAVSEWEFDHRVGWSDNPHWGYRGDIYGWWGNTTDYGVYPEALVPALDEFGFYGETFYAQGDRSELIARLDWGMPTLVWLGFWGDTGYYESTEDGTPYKLAAGMHVVVAYGYDDWGVYVSDPASGDYTSYAWGDFMWMWNVLDGMALAVAPYS
ncbi:MAG: C39 family peptidase [Chloroflexota bacterium]|nr:C39 family peptidase [Chloroflexota bacterium]